MLRLSKKSILVLIVLVGGVSFWSGHALTQNKPQISTTPPTMKLGTPLPANLFVELAKAINPSVVNISTSVMPRQGGGRMQTDPLMQMLEQLYGRQFQMPRSRPEQALGTGFIIRADGLIITNNHVIEGADVINVQLTENADDKVYEATVIGRDPRTDVALIKISPGNSLTPAPLGSSKDVEVGEWVAAFGNPFGHGHSMTKGIISAKGRAINELNQFPFLQTDASINPGNSGGPLVNSKGLVIGVNTAIDARAQGIGFAIPIDEVKQIVEQLEKTGRVKRGYLGVTLGELDERAADYLGLDSTDGAVLTDIIPGGPAAKAGLETYDVVTNFGGTRIKNLYDLQNSVAMSPIGQKAKVEVLRNGKKRTHEILVTEAPDNSKPKPAQQKYNGQKAPFDIGFTVTDPTAQMREDLDLPKAHASKPIIIDVVRGSVASFAGLRPGDVILDVNRDPVNKATDVLKKLRKGKNTLRVARGPMVAVIIFETE